VANNHAGKVGPGRRGATAVGTARRQQVLDIAARLFATRGYSQTTVRDIADEAGILSGSLYHHFDSKETMAVEVLSDFMGSLLERFNSIVADSADPRDALDGLVRAAYLAIHEQPYAVASYQNESALFASVPRLQFVQDASAEIESIWRGVLEKGRERGDFRSDVDPALAYLFIRDAVWSAVKWYKPNGKYKHDVLADQFLTLLHAGLTVRS
jgi:TetR/AcrR family transcriptional regulator, cholesterol catabolism regulator